VLTVERVIATTHEVSLKGKNRRWFERRLTTNVRRALKDLPTRSVNRPAWRILVTFAEPVPFSEVARRLGTVFGLHAILPVRHAGYSLEDVDVALRPLLADMPPNSFAVRCLRSDKRFPLTSIEIEREIGSRVQAATGWPVDLGRPQLTVHLLLDENGFWLWFAGVAGPGGLPVGTGGRAVALLSGGIDSPVAAYMMMKRGMRLDFVHFHSVPRTDPASLEKVEELVRILNRYQGGARLATVPLLPIQEAIVAGCPAPLRVLLYRRFMLRLAQLAAQRFNARALVTGESLGQVASQTVENLAAVEAIATLPVLRPLIGLDKQEIISLARRAGTYETSILPHLDCCSFHVPERPETRADRDQLAAAESVLPIEEMVSAAVRDSEVLRITESVPWNVIPLPPGVTDILA